MVMIVMVLHAVDDDEDYDDEYDDANDDDDDDDDDDVYADHESTLSVIRDGSIGAAQGILSPSTVIFSSFCDCCCDTCMCCTSSTLTEHAGWCY
jgi:hypothetical protein